MATWTNIPDERIEPNKPIRAVDGIALRDNPMAIAEGAAGAPRIQNPAYQDESITWNKLHPSGAANRIGSAAFAISYGQSSGDNGHTVWVNVPYGAIGFVMAQWAFTDGFPQGWIRLLHGSVILAEQAVADPLRMWAMANLSPGDNALRIEFQRPGAGVIQANGLILGVAPLR